MTKQIPWFAVIIVFIIAQGVVHAQPMSQDFSPGFAGYVHTTPAAPSKKVILLNNGQVIGGDILSDGEPVQIRNELGVIPIPRADIVLVAATLQEIYQYQKTNTPKTSDGYLKLGDWCLVNKLVNEAMTEFDRAIHLADNPQSADAIRNRKNAVLSMFGECQLQTQMIEQENQKYRLWKQKIPSATFTAFKREILPMLVQNCTGIACHSSNSLNEFRLVANPYNSDVDVAKNLDIVLGYITPGLPNESPLALIPIAPHGRTKEIFTLRNYAQYEKLYFWTGQVAGEMDAYHPLAESDHVAAIPGNKHYPATHPQDFSNMLVADGVIATPTPDGTSIVTPTTDNPSAHHQPSSLMQGLTRDAGTSGFSPAQRSDFGFFTQPSIVPPGPSPGGWSSPTPARPGMQQDPKTNIMTHDSTDAFVQNKVLQQLQRDPVDPFDPVLFNRQFHLRRLSESGNL